MIDFHTHILPRLDDGSQSVADSVRMLKELEQQKVSIVCATPHFYASRTTPEKFFSHRQAAYTELLPHLCESFPKILLGAEVYYYSGISRSENLESFRLQNTDFLLLEMPFSKWNRFWVDEVCELASSDQFTVVLAHIYRYRSYYSQQDLERLMNAGAVLQLNTESLFGFLSKKRALNDIARGRIHFIGSDCHNTTDRVPNLGQAFEVIRSSVGYGYEEQINAYFKNHLLNT